jgi:hypothetical protein
MLTVILSQNKFNSITCLTFSNNKKRKGERELKHLLPERFVLVVFVTSFIPSSCSIGEVSQMKIDTLSLTTSDGKNDRFFFFIFTFEMIFLGFDSLNTIIITEKIESSEPCWDGYQVNK